MITNGTVTIEDGTKAKEEYAPARKVSVSISFAVPEGVTESAQSKVYLDTAGSIASAKVDELLGRGAARRATVTAVDVTVETLASASEPPKKTTRTPKKKDETPAADKTKADLAAEAGLPVTDTVHKGNPPSLVEDELNDEPAKAPEADPDELGDLLGDSAPAPVTDAELAKAAQVKNGLMKQKAPDTWQPAKIRDLIAAYAGPAPKKITDIPAAKRREFLTKLEALA